MSTLRRTATVLAFSGLLMLIAGPALAHICTNANKVEGAGSGAIATVELTTFEFTLVEGNINPQGRIQGGFVTLVFLWEGQELATFDTYTHLTLPEMAQNAGPGDSECDGVGVDDIGACLNQILGG
jgi:hypothetical protein